MKKLTPQETLQAILANKKVEYRHPHLNWTILEPTRLKLSKLLESEYQFRLVQEMLTVGNISFPKPVSEPPELGTEYWIADPSHGYYATTVPIFWNDDSQDRIYLKRGLVHVSRENAIEHAKALIKLSGGTVDE